VRVTRITQEELRRGAPQNSDYDVLDDDGNVVMTVRRQTTALPCDCNPLSSAPCECRSAGAEQERAATEALIVAWLRNVKPSEFSLHRRGWARWFADAIERGEHRK
jgi:hypothetical protein